MPTTLVLPARGLVLAHPEIVRVSALAGPRSEAPPLGAPRHPTRRFRDAWLMDWLKDGWEAFVHAMQPSQRPSLRIPRLASMLGIARPPGGGAGVPTLLATAYTSGSGTHAVHERCKKISIICVGAGGGGGANVRSGGGGGGGCCSLDGVIQGDRNVEYTVGSGGAVGTAGGNRAVTSSALVAPLVATGGSAGGTPSGGVGGSGSGGANNTSGGGGGVGYDNAGDTGGGGGGGGGITGNGGDGGGTFSGGDNGTGGGGGGGSSGGSARSGYGGGGIYRNGGTSLAFITYVGGAPGALPSGYLLFVPSGSGANSAGSGGGAGGGGGAGRGPSNYVAGPGGSGVIGILEIIVV
jgi:hypothetical protein